MSYITRLTQFTGLSMLLHINPALAFEQEPTHKTPEPAPISSPILSPRTPRITRERSTDSEYMESNNINPKFQTENESFTTEYSALAHHQESINEILIRNICEYIPHWFPNHAQKPISILDLGCGYGKTTYDLHQSLKAKRINVHKIVGYDISSDQILQAQEQYKDEHTLEFRVQNIEDMEDNQQYDVVVSFFTLQWMESLRKTTKLIKNATNPGGKLVCYVPLGDKGLFDQRCKLLDSPKWHEHFSQYSLTHFIDDEQIYKKTFEKYYETSQELTTKDERHFIYTTQEFNTFLSSWMQELRHLRTKNIDGATYATDLVNQVVQDALTDSIATIKIDHENNIHFTGYYYLYIGTLSEATA